VAKPRITTAEAADLVRTYEPITLVIAILEAAKTAGFPHSFAIMETDEESTATLTMGGMTKTMRRHIRETLTKTAVPRG
jgi:hypothetical protein